MEGVLEIPLIGTRSTGKKKRSREKWREDFGSMKRREKRVEAEEEKKRRSPQHLKGRSTP